MQAEGVTRGGGMKDENHVDELVRWDIAYSIREELDLDNIICLEW